MKKTGKIAAVALLTLLLILTLYKRITRDRAVASPAEAAPSPTIQVTTTPVPEMAEPLTVRISEVMSSNKSFLSDETGAFPDWVELYNYGESTAELTGCELSCGGSGWHFPDCELAAGEYLLLLCGDGDGLRPDFSIPREGASLTLTDTEGRETDRLTVPALAENNSYFPGEEGDEGTATVWPTPGYENSLEGYRASQENMALSSPLQISEAMVYNQWVLNQQGEYYDWVELKNTSGTPINLSDYFLSDKGSQRDKCQLPDHTLEPGRSCVVLCTGEDTVDNRAILTIPLSLSAENEDLYLSYKDGSLCDYLWLHDVPYGGTIGRMEGARGTFYFAEPTPDAANKNGLRSIAPTPESDTASGLYSGSITVSLRGEGQIYYTLDCSTPTANAIPYTGPITVSETTIIRAVSVLDGAMDSHPLDLSYLINETFTLPVASLVCDPGSFNAVYRNPNQDNERPCSIAFFDGEEGFYKECGFKLHGATSKVAQEKKSMKLCFRSRYDGELEYDLFGNDVTHFSSVLLRAAQEDTFSTLIRDNLMHQLAMECGFGALSTQDYHYTILFINGRYWGIYNFREAHSTDHFANHFGYPEETLTQYKETWGIAEPFRSTYEFAMSADLSVEENYRRVASVFDVDSIIQWSIIEAYCDNMDANPPNMRFYVSSEDDLLHYALVDLDLGFFADFRCFQAPYETGYLYSDLAKRLLNNGEYREKLCQTLSEALHGPMSDEHVKTMLDGFSAQIAAEIPRDRERWGGSEFNWNNMLDFIRDIIDGRAIQMARSCRGYTGISDASYSKFFGDIVS